MVEKNQQPMRPPLATSNERKKPGSFAGSEREYFYSFQQNNSPVSFSQES
jgi:hypothetical protein